MQIVSRRNGDNLHGMSNPVFLGQIRKLSSICRLLIEISYIKYYDKLTLHC